MNDWSDFTLDKAFAGRGQELDILKRELLLPQPKVVALTGAPGSGKTALAMMFAHMHRDAFPAGIYHIRASHLESLARTIDAHVSNPTAPYLLILDELSERSPRQQYDEIQAVRITRPTARLLCVSRSVGWSGPADLTLELGNLSQADFYALLERLGVRPEFASAHSDLYGLLAGNPLSARLVADLLRSGSITPRELLTRLSAFQRSGLLGADGRPLSQSGERKIITDVTSVSDELLAKVHLNPKLLYELSPRGFEEFVADVLSRLGYQITLTPASKDGGKDIYAAKKDHLGSFLYVVECKKYAPDHPVGVGLIRQLNGVVQAEKATAGILATTSFFTKGAKEFQSRVAHQMGLKDYLGLQEWLDTIFKK